MNYFKGTKNCFCTPDISLKDSCLDCIVNNFDRYMIAYKSGKGVPLLHFEFLQRKYSTFLYEKFSADEETLMKNVDFLINSHIKELNLHYCDLVRVKKQRLDSSFQFEPNEMYHCCSKMDITPIIQQVKTVGETITHLSFCAKNYSTDILMQITSLLPNISSLKLRGPHVSDAVLQNIGNNCPSLQDFDVVICPEVTDEGLKALCTNAKCTDDTGKNVTLLSLDLRRTSVTKNGIIFALKNFPNLKVLRHETLISAIHYSYCFASIESFLSEVKYNLEELDITWSKFLASEKNIKMLAELCPHVSKLLSLTYFQGSANACAGFQQLKEVYFGHEVELVPASIDLTPFVKLRGKNLTMLHIHGGRVSVESVVTSCQALKSFHLRRTVLNPFEELKDSTHAYSLRYLEDLSLDEMAFDKDIFIKSINLILSSSPVLVKICFNGKLSIAAPLYSFKVTGKQNCASSLRKLEIFSVDMEYNTLENILTALNLEIINMKPLSVPKLTFEIFMQKIMHMY